MKVLITGGHFSPAYSVIQELLRRGDEVVIVGRIHPQEGDKSALSYEYRVSKELNLQFIEISTGRLQRRITVHTIPSAVRFARGLLHARKILEEVKPDVLLTFGGYLALPVAAAAKMSNIPIVTHEQTQGIGLANSLIAKIAQTVCVSFPSTKKLLSHSHVVLTGNPLRKEIFQVDEKIAYPKNLPILYITGGSTGSHIINTTIGKSLEILLEKYVIIHQTGENEYNDYERLIEEKKKISQSLQERYIVTKYIYPSQIGYIYKTADIVIGRSGANTTLELIACNKPSILIPLPYGQKGEQLQNARLIQSLGLGELLEQRDLSPNSLYEIIERMNKHIEKYHISKDIIEQYIFDDAAQRIVHELSAQYEKTHSNKRK